MKNALFPKPCPRYLNIPQYKIANFVFLRCIYEPLCLQAFLLQVRGQQWACFHLFYPNFQHSSAPYRLQRHLNVRKEPESEIPHCVLSGTDYHTKQEESSYHSYLKHSAWSLTGIVKGMCSGRLHCFLPICCASVCIGDSVQCCRPGHGDGISNHHKNVPRFQSADTWLALHWTAQSASGPAVLSTSIAPTWPLWALTTAYSMACDVMLLYVTDLYRKREAWLCSLWVFIT